MSFAPFMKRASVLRVSSRGSILGADDRRDLIALQAELDKSIYNTSLGCPLASFENASLSLVGGKALQCWRLTKHGFPVPASFVVPSYVHSLHIAEAGVASLVNKVFSTPLFYQQEDAKQVLETIRNKIMETPLNEDVLENLETFLSSLPEGSDFAVRSSATAEDLAAQSFAGQYDSFLFKSSMEEISESIKACWASMYKENVLDYFEKSQASEIASSIPIPSMGVLVMKMVDASSSGVCFSQNLWGDAAKETLIEAVLGQGEGLVSGDITPDRYVMDKSSMMVHADTPGHTQKYVRANNMDGVEKVELDPVHKGPVLSAVQLKRLTIMAKAIEEFYNSPQDIEWAIDREGHIFLLQSRSITTKDACSLGFLPPGEGHWQFDPTHFPRPASLHLQQNYGFDYYQERSRRIGSLISSIQLKFVHGFAFSQPVLFPPSEVPKLERAAQAYWEKKLFEDEYREFTDFFRSDCEKLIDSLRVVNPSALSHNALVDYVGKCFDICVEMWKLHHSYTAPTVAVVGDFQNRMAKLTGRDPFETLELLEAASPESRGILNMEDSLLNNMYTLLRESEKAQELLKCDESMASWALTCLLHMPGELGRVMQEVALIYGWRLAGGYDLVVPTMIESPNFFLKTILHGVEEDGDAADRKEKEVEALCEEWRSSLPEEKRAEFDEILSVGRRFFRIRDERGLCTDLSGVGICRRGILEAGRRLAESGVINKPEHLCCATKEEAIALLVGDLGRIAREKRGPIEVPTAAELERRHLYIKNADPSSVPRTLGPPPTPPPESPLPPNIARTMDAVHTGGLRGIWDEGEGHSEEDIVKNPNKVKGLAASKGAVTGPVRLIIQDSDLAKVKKGEILVTYSTSASFNMVLGLAKGIVTNYGGMLSHAAIVSREYGVPAVVGTQDATKKFKNGDIVTVDAVEGTVTCIERMEGRKMVKTLENAEAGYQHQT